MKKYTFLAALGALSVISTSAFGAALVVNFDDGGFNLKDKNGVLLSGGLPLAPHDGVVIQLGYFSGAATDGNNFVGNFVPLTGKGSANFAPLTQFDTTIGDDTGLAPDTDGHFSTTVVFDPSLQVGLPPVGTILSIRIFDNKAVTAQGLNFMTISSNLWKWKAPGALTDPNATINLSLADGNSGDIRLENRLAGGGTSSTPNGSALAGDPRANVPAVSVPEPSSIILALTGCIGFVGMRRRK